MQRLADRIASYLCPAVIVIAVLAFFRLDTASGRSRASRTPGSAVSVLIIACPCALALQRRCPSWWPWAAGAHAVCSSKREALETLAQVDTLVVG